MTLTYEDFNLMTLSEISNLQGIGKTVAKRIVAMRPYRETNDLFKVKGLGARTLKVYGLEKVKNTTRRKWVVADDDGEEYPANALATDTRTNMVKLFWRVPKEYREYLTK
tara:strand:- start:329 stop:658 length:330 start_codon:yes stop_codon:yes gene_type:complete